MVLLVTGFPRTPVVPKISNTLPAASPSVGSTGVIVVLYLYMLGSLVMGIRAVAYSVDEFPSCLAYNPFSLGAVKE